MATREELEAERATLRSARASLLSGQMVKEVWRDGRRLTYQGITVDQLNEAIADVDAQIAELGSADRSSRPRFSALSVRFHTR